MSSEDFKITVESVVPEPTSEARLAIELALLDVWPKPQVAAVVSENWRFSGRPWSGRANRFRP